MVKKFLKIMYFQTNKMFELLKHNQDTPMLTLLSINTLVSLPCIDQKVLGKFSVDWLSFILEINNRSVTESCIISNLISFYPLL